MAINDERSKTMYEETRKIAEGKIRCTGCGNDDWVEFIYVSGGTAGCKKCGSVYQYNGTWELKTKGLMAK